MEQTIKLEMTKDEATLLNVVMDQCLKTVREAIERIDQTEAETLRLQAETRVMLGQLRLMFNVEKNIRSVYQFRHARAESGEAGAEDSRPAA